MSDPTPDLFTTPPPPEEFPFPTSLEGLKHHVSYYLYLRRKAPNLRTDEETRWLHYNPITSALSGSTRARVFLNYLNKLEFTSPSEPDSPAPEGEDSLFDPDEDLIAWTNQLALEFHHITCSCNSPTPSQLKQAKHLVIEKGWRPPHAPRVSTPLEDFLPSGPSGEVVELADPVWKPSVQAQQAAVELAVEVMTSTKVNPGAVSPNEPCPRVPKYKLVERLMAADIIARMSR